MVEKKRRELSSLLMILSFALTVAIYRDFIVRSYGGDIP